MFLGGWTFSVIIIGLYISFGLFQASLASYILPITLIAFAGTIVESLPFQDIDNITVTFTAIILGTLFW